MKNVAIFPACNVGFNTDMHKRGASFYLAAEEYLAREMPQENYVFIWRLPPTCVFGRNQDPSTELDLTFCKRHGVEIMRRRSGGGAIFADENNLMISLVTGSGSVEELFGEFSQTVAKGLRALGVPADASGRNDIMLEGQRKICGGAFYHMGNKNIVHCTMLYDTNPTLMQGCLTPQNGKLESKGVKSVQSRIGLLKDYLPYGINILKEKLRAILTNRSIMLTGNDISRIEALEKPYLDTQYIYGKGRCKAEIPELTFCRRIDGCGSIELKLYADAQKMFNHLSLAGDFFQSGETSPAQAFSEALNGCCIDATHRDETARQLKDAIMHHKPYLTIRNLSENDIMEMISQ